MTRIIQRCFAVLAFTGILLAHAQETTVSEVSDTTLKSSEQTSPSAPDNRLTSIETPSSFSPVDKVEDEKNSHTEVATGSSSPDVIKYGGTEKTISADKENSDDTKITTTEFVRSEELQGGSPKSYEKNVQSTTGPSVRHSEGLFRASLKELQQNGAELTSEKIPIASTDISEQKSPVGTTDDPLVKDSSNKHGTSVKYDAVSDISRTSWVTEATKGEKSAQTIEKNSSEYSSNDSGQSSVPSKDNMISTSSIDREQVPKDMFSTTPSKAQTDELDENGKSATHKRSLNVTNAMTKSTTVENTELPSSTEFYTLSHTLSPSAMAEIKTMESEIGSGNISPNPQTEVLMSTSDHRSGAENSDASITHEKVVTGEIMSPYTINSAAENLGVTAVHSEHDDHLLSDPTSVIFHHDTQKLPISSAALSSFSKESIHPSERIDTTAQTSSFRHDISTASAPQKSPELEVEYSLPSHYSEDSESLITFDPNGMTHNFSQDPDSITFSPGTFHIDGMSTDSHLENSESVHQSPSVLTDLVKSNEGTTRGFESIESSLENMDREREREIVSPTYGLLPHDEPDAEEMSSRNLIPSTKPPQINPIFTSGSISSLTTGTPENKFIYPLNDESEEMLNDSPHFGEIQSKSTMTPVTETKKDFVNKDLDINVSNDISHTTGASSQNSKATHELDFSIDYKSEQTEIRPVTAASPPKTSESITILPDSLNAETHAPLGVTNPGHSDTVLPDTSSPIILPNPAPSVVNQTAEAVTVVSQPDIVPERTASEFLNGSESNTAVNSATTIAGVAVKTSVSVSLPLSKTSNISTNPDVDTVADDAKILQNISGILPFPIHISKDADGHPPPTTLNLPPTVVSTEASTISTTASGGLRIRKPKVRIGTTSDEPETPRTRKPFLAPPQRSSTTVGPPVSIFKKSRTRVASITSSTTAKPFRQFSTIRIHYASRIPGMVPDGELVFSIEPVTTTVPTTTETEEPFSDEPFTEQTQGPIVPSEDDVTLKKVAGCIVVEKGLRWNEQLNNRHSPQYKEKANYVQIQLDRLFRTSPIASQLWRTQIDGFSGKRKSKAVVIDFFLYLIKSKNEISTEQLTSVFHDKLINNTFSRFTVDPNKTTFEFLNEEPMKPTTEAPESQPEPVLPQWAIAVIVVGAASLIFIVLFAVVAILGRHHMRRRYSNKLNDEDSDRPSDWESKMAAAYENLAADTIYDVEDLHSDTYKKKYNSTYHGRPSKPQRADSWSSSDWSPPPRRPRPQVHRIVY